MFTSIALDARDIQARKDAMRWLARQMTWENRLSRMRGQRSKSRPKATKREAA